MSDVWVILKVRLWESMGILTPSGVVDFPVGKHEGFGYIRCFHTQQEAVDACEDGDMIYKFVTKSKEQAK